MANTTFINSTDTYFLNKNNLSILTLTKPTITSKSILSFEKAANMTTHFSTQNNLFKEPLILFEYAYFLI